MDMANPPGLSDPPSHRFIGSSAAAAYLTTDEVAALLDRPVAVIRYRIRTGRLCALRRRGRWLISLDEAIRWYQIDRLRPYRKQRRPPRGGNAL